MNALKCALFIGVSLSILNTMACASGVSGKCYANSMARKCPILDLDAEGSMTRDYSYKVLDLFEKDSTEQIVSNCYRKLSKICHPDKSDGSTKQQILLNNAKDCLILGECANETGEKKRFPSDIRKQIIEDTGLQSDTDLGSIPEYLSEFPYSYDNIVTAIKIFTKSNRESDLQLLFVLDINKLRAFDPRSSGFSKLKSDVMKLIEAGVSLEQLFSHELIAFGDTDRCDSHLFLSGCYSLSLWLVMYADSIEQLANRGIHVNQLLALDPKIRHWIMTHSSEVINNLDQGIPFEEIVEMDEHKFDSMFQEFLQYDEYEKNLSAESFMCVSVDVMLSVIALITYQIQRLWGVAKF